MKNLKVIENGQRNGACRARREAFARELRFAGLPGALLVQPAHLAYFFGLWGWRQNLPAAGLVSSEGEGVLAVGASADCTYFADRAVLFEDSRMSTPVEDRPQLAVEALLAIVSDPKLLGTDIARFPVTGRNPVVDIITKMRRSKQADEVALIQHSVRAIEAGYRALVPVVREGLTEIELYSVFQAAATIYAGVPVGELGNDFRGGAPAGGPRPVPLRAGDLIPVDAGVALYNYNSDMCRTYAVSGKRTALQETAFQRVRQGLELAESLIRPGVSCRAVYAEVSDFLTSGTNWRFGHHLGHGIGLAAVESPRINPNWDDYFQEGDTLTLEPGIYGEGLNEGIRLEQNYVILDGKLQPLSTLPLDL